MCLCMCCNYQLFVHNSFQQGQSRNNQEGYKAINHSIYLIPSSFASYSSSQYIIVIKP